MSENEESNPSKEELKQRVSTQEMLHKLDRMIDEFGLQRIERHKANSRLLDLLGQVIKRIDVLEDKVRRMQMRVVYALGATAGAVLAYELFAKG